MAYQSTGHALARWDALGGNLPRQTIHRLERAEVEALAVTKGYGADMASFVAGYYHRPLGPDEAYPGPARSAHQAGWVAGNPRALAGATRGRVDIDGSRFGIPPHAPGTCLPLCSSCSYALEVAERAEAVEENRRHEDAALERAARTFRGYDEGIIADDDF